MSRSLLLAAALAWAGATLLLGRVRWFRRPPLAERIRPYLTGAGTPVERPANWSLDAFREVLGPLARSIGARLSRLFGVSEELAVRLERVHSPLDVTGFRLRQLGWVVSALGLALLGVVAVRPPATVTLFAVLGLPLLAFLLVEQDLARRSTAWQRRLFLELPVVTEQLGMLLSAGYSLGAALARLLAPQRRRHRPGPPARRRPHPAGHLGGAGPRRVGPPGRGAVGRPPRGRARPQP